LISLAVQGSGDSWSDSDKSESTSSDLFDVPTWEGRVANCISELLRFAWLVRQNSEEVRLAESVHELRGEDVICDGQDSEEKLKDPISERPSRLDPSRKASPHHEGAVKTEAAVPYIQGDAAKRYGLSEIGPVGPTDTVDVDVICVHGLMGHPRETWTNDNNGFFWLAHVAQDLAHIRVLTFGYDADPSSVMGWVNQNRLREHARDLLTEAARKREKTNTEDRPIIWIAHSLGGLVVEMALAIGDTYSENDKHLKKIARHTIGIINLGTPDAGSDLAAWAQTATRSLRSVHANKDVEVLTADSDLLRDTDNTLARFLETRKKRNSRDIKPFHEMLAISNVGTVVSIASASTFGYQREGIYANHMV
jgi:hypothetical protein